LKKIAISKFWSNSFGKLISMRRGPVALLSFMSFKKNTRPFNLRSDAPSPDLLGPFQYDLP